MAPSINPVAKIKKLTLFLVAVSLEKYRFNQLEKPVSEKAHPGQVDYHCSG